MAKILYIYFDIPDTYCLLFPSSTCAQPAVGIFQTSLIPLNQSKAAMPFTSVMKTKDIIQPRKLRCFIKELLV